MIGELIVRVLCCASVLVESPVPVHVQAAVVVTPVIWFQTVKRSAISWRHPVADSRCRRGRKCGEMRLNADRNRCACPGEVNRFIGTVTLVSVGDLGGCVG